MLEALGARCDGDRRLLLPGHMTVTILNAGDQPEGVAAVAATSDANDIVRLELGG